MVEIPSFQWSELARRSAEVGAALDEHGEVMVKRGAQTLRLAPKDSDETVLITRDLFHLLTGLASCDSPELVSKALTTAWPWTRSLPAHDQILLVKEVAPIAEMCVSLGVYRPLLEELASWRRTARAWADGCTPIGPIDEPYGALARRPNA
ncbi:MAG: hypothetical protein ACKOFZ_02825 [Ilumatobacteraceae bacterium]|jgi:hypothetical protein